MPKIIRFDEVNDMTIHVNTVSTDMRH